MRPIGILREQMSRLYRWGDSRSYDPAAYWRKRENPNNARGEAPDRVSFDAGFIRSAVGDVERVFELGPGVGRTFGAYSRGSHVTTLDLSRTYLDRLTKRADDLGVTLHPHFVSDPMDRFPFTNTAFAIGVTSQVLMHVPPSVIRHTMSELIRVCQKVVIIATYQGAMPAQTQRSNHVFYHDYAGISTELGCEMNHVIANEGRLLFTMTRR